MYPDEYPIGLCTKQWRASDEFIEQQRPALNHVVEIKCEQLTAGPTANLASRDRFSQHRSVCGFTVQREVDSAGQGGTDTEHECSRLSTPE